MSIDICPRCEGSGYERSGRLERCHDCEGRGYSAALIVRTEPFPVEWRSQFIETGGYTRYTMEAWACASAGLTLGELAQRTGATTTQVADVLSALGVNRAMVEAHINGIPHITELETHMRNRFGGIIAAAVKLVHPVDV